MKLIKILRANYKRNVLLEKYNIIEVNCDGLKFIERS